MRRILSSLLLAAAVAGVCPSLSLASGPPPVLAVQPPNACALLPKEEVRKHLTWPGVVDSVIDIEEERVGGGSACEYPSVRVQVLPFSHSVLDAERKKPQVESVPGLGEEAFFVPRVRQYAELYVRTGRYLLTLQAGVPTGQTVDGIKPAVVTLAKALVEKLR